MSYIVGALCVLVAMLSVATVSTLMRLNVAEHRLASAERSLEKLSSVWWQGMQTRYSAPPWPTDDPASLKAFRDNFPE